MGLKLEGFAPFLLEPVDLEVAPCEIVFLTGPSGSGKSLFLRAVADLDVHQGTARLEGAAMEEIPAPEWRRRIGYLTAESHWWFERVGDHFTQPDTEQASSLGLPEAVYGWPVSRLSSGEKQRLALLRLLQQEPRALLLDEPTANQDHDSALRVEALIQSYVASRDTPAIWVSHNSEQMQRIAGRRLAIRAGQVVPA